MKKLYSLLSLYIALLCCANAHGETLSESFEGATFVPTDWSVIHVSGTSNWTRASSDGYVSPKNGSYAAKIAYASAGHENYLVTPLLRPASGESLHFHIASQNYTGTTITIEVSETDNSTPSSFTKINESAYTYKSNVNINSTWGTEKIIPLDDYVGKDIYIAFHVVDNNGGNVYIDNVTGVTLKPLTCPNPTTLNYSNLSISNVDLSWTAGGSESKWNLLYKAGGGDWNTVSVNSNTYTLAILPATTYQIKVQADCGDGDKSVFSDIISFDSPCADITSLPWNEDFSGLAGNAVPNCWDNSASTTYPDGYGAPAAVAWTGYTTGTNSMIRMYNCYAHAGTALINTPQIVIPSTGTYELTFRHAHNADCGNFFVKVSTDGGSNFETVAPTAGFQNTETITSYGSSIPTTFVNDTVSLSTFAGQTIIIQFFANATYGGGAILLDDVSVHRFTTCTTPAAPSVSHILNSTARLTWTAGGSETEWNVLYKKSTDAVWNTISGVTVNPYTLTGLDYATNYDVKIQAVCSPDDESYPSETTTFTTPCTAYGTPWVENFEDEAINVVATCFDNSSSTAHNNAAGQVTGINAIWQTHECNDNKFARMGAYWAGEGLAILNTPQIILPTDEVQELTFDYANNTYFENAGSEIEVPLKLNISIDGGATFTELMSFAQSGITDSVNPGTFIEEALVLDAYVGQTIILQFVTDNPEGNSLGAAFVDNLDIHRYTDCKTPKSLTCTGTTIYGATLDWTVGSDEIQWLLQYSENGILWSKEITVDSKPYTLDNLSPGTYYYARVRAVCDESEISAYSNITTFTTQCGTYTIDDLPWAHNFENDKPGSGLIPACWTSTPYSYTDAFGDTKTYPYVYKFDTLTDNDYKRAHDGSKYICFYGGSTTVPSEQYIVLPEIEEDLETLTLVFWHKQFQTNSDYPQFTVGYVTDLDNIAGSFNSITDVDRTAAWSKDSIDFKEEGVSGTGYVAFKWGGGINVYNVDYGYIDGIEICPDKYIFTNEDGDHRWENPLNWNKKAVPEIIHDVIIRAEAEVNENIKGTVKSAIIDRIEQRRGSIEINPNGVLVIEDDLRQKNIRRTPVATSSDFLIVNSSAAGNGVLTIGSHDGSNCATVNFYTKSRHDANGWINQFIGSPFNYDASKDVYVDYYLSYLYKFDPSITNWENQKHGTPPEPYIGYNILRKKENPDILPMKGSLIPTGNHTYNLYYASDHNQNVLANSWTAPIDIASIGTAAFVNAEATIYLFNAGSKPQNKGKWSDDGTFVADQASQDAAQEGQFIALPVGSAPWTSPTIKVIPPMQAFIVVANSANAKLNINYQSMVYTPTLNKTQADITAPTRIKQRYAEEKPDIMRLHITGQSGYADVLNILVREDFTAGFDNGYDGRKFAGSSPAPLLYALSDAGEMAVLCVADAEGTRLGLLTSEDSLYCITFDYDGEQTLYLNDYETVSSTCINNNATYTFRADTSSESRFVISATPIANVATGITGTTSSEQGAGKASKVLLNNQLFIIRAGRIYSATGTLIR